MSPPANERGGHARPRGLFAPRPRHNGGRGHNGASDASTGPRGSNGGPGSRDAAPGPDTALPVPLSSPPLPEGHQPGRDSRAPGPDSGEPSPGNGASAPGSPAPGAPAPGDSVLAPGPAVPQGLARASRSARHGAPSSGRPGRKSSPAVRRARRSRIAIAAVVAIGILVIGLATGFGSEPSAEPTAQSFLFAWQQQQYAAAGALTTAPADTVAASLRGAVGQLDATQMFLSMKSVVQHGGTAEAAFTATVNLAQQGRVWNYQGHFALRRVGGGWKVVWAPSVINPNLGSGERLAVVTTFPDRAAVLDDMGNPLQLKAQAYVLGVMPDHLASPANTAQAFASHTGLQAGQVLGQITAAPPHSFLPLATLDSITYAKLRPSLRGVPGLMVRPEPRRLFQATATGLVGEVGSEINERLRADGALYAPGTTVGLSGLEQKYQRQLLGTPTTQVIAVNSAGQQTGILAQWPGTTGTPVRTTIDSAVQNASLTALRDVSSSGEIVAVRASTGDVLAVAQRQASGALPGDGALNAKLAPGTAFTIVSAAALVKHGVSVSTPIPCARSFNVQGRTFTSQGTGEPERFSTAFAEGCGTAFAQLSERLTASQWAQVLREFGIGSDWSQLQVPAFAGSVPAAASDANLAAQTIGMGNIQMSLLSMAMVAATVDAGRWHVPQVLRAPDPPGGGAELDEGMMTAVRGLMRGAVRSGAAQAASLPGQQVYGQVGLVHTGSGWISWFVGYRGDIAIAAIESGKTPQLSAAALARDFFSAAPR